MVELERVREKREREREREKEKGDKYEICLRRCCCSPSWSRSLVSFPLRQVIGLPYPAPTHQLGGEGLINDREAGDQMPTYQTDREREREIERNRERECVCVCVCVCV